MGNELIETFSNEPEVNLENVTSLSYGFKKRTGERFAKATTKDGKTYIKTLSEAGVEEQSMITIPPCSSKEERDEVVVDLAKKYTQDDIADMVGCSQSTVSGILREDRKKKKKKKNK